MWLINCRTLTLEEHLDFKSIKYAILSHTWDSGEEVQFDEFRSKTERGKRGWQKIKQTCRQALDDGFDLAWVDTCCIDKKSSAELSEAINSMFPWYGWSGICYIFLGDYDVLDPDQDLSCSRWFSRGWTLQELIAPARVRFYDRSWKYIGGKESMSKELSLITGIEERILHILGHEQLESALEELPVARKMSWASDRKTTRVEDMAYSLLGILGINLPLLYGEGERAFVRLQEEIMKNSNDISLLAWVETEPAIRKRERCGVLARHAGCFRSSRTLYWINHPKQMPDFSSTNKGLRLETELIVHDRDEGIYALDINCVDPVGSGRPLSILLIHQDHNIFERAEIDDLAEVDGSPTKETRTIFLSKEFDSANTDSESTQVESTFLDSSTIGFPATTVDSFFVPEFTYDPMLWYRSEVHPRKLWQNANGRFLVTDLREFTGCHVYRPRDASAESSYHLERPFYVFFGFVFGSITWIRVKTLERDHSMKLSRWDWEDLAHSASREASWPVCVGFVDDASVLPRSMRHWTVAIMLRATVTLTYERRIIVGFQTEISRA